MKISTQTKMWLQTNRREDKFYFGFFFTEVHLEIQSEIVVIVENLKEA